MGRKLHEFLGSQKQVFTQAEKVRGDLTALFDKKSHHFGEKLTTFTPDAEDAKTLVEAQSTLQTTVSKELKWFTGPAAKALDSEATIDEGNMKARGDVIIGEGENQRVILKQVPATQLLQLDKRLGELLTLVNQIPTLDPAAGFTLDKTRSAGVYVAKEVTKRRTKKEQVPIVLLQPTVEHAGQAQLITKDIEIGTIVERQWSGLITPKTKAEMLERVEALRTAVKQARARANDIVIDEVKIGQTLLDFVFEPAVKPQEDAA